MNLEIMSSYYTRTPGREIRNVECRFDDRLEGIPLLLPFIRCVPNDTVQRYFDAKWICCVDDVMHEWEGDSENLREFRRLGGVVVDRATVKETDVLVVKMSII